jgi:hypothetical protein
MWAQYEIKGPINLTLYKVGERLLGFESDSIKKIEPKESCLFL